MSCRLFGEWMVNVELDRNWGILTDEMGDFFVFFRDHYASNSMENKSRRELEVVVGSNQLYSNFSSICGDSANQFATCWGCDSPIGAASAMAHRFHA